MNDHRKTVHPDRDEHDQEKQDRKDEGETTQQGGTVSESTANPTPPAEEATTSPGVHDTPQLPPDHEQDPAH